MMCVINGSSCVEKREGHSWQGDQHMHILRNGNWMNSGCPRCSMPSFGPPQSLCTFCSPVLERPFPQLSVRLATSPPSDFYSYVTSSGKPSLNTLCKIASLSPSRILPFSFTLWRASGTKWLGSLPRAKLPEFDPCLCVTLGKLHYFSVPPFPHLERGRIIRVPTHGVGLRTE